mgnify:CR=1 FL=1|jgi:hypothetical protein
MLEFLESYFTNEKIKMDTLQVEYLKVMDYEMLLCDEFKVLHIQDNEYISIHHNGSVVPVAVKQLSNS